MKGLHAIGAFLGLDVGKGEHHVAAVPPAGKKAFDNRLPNSEPELRAVFHKLQAKPGTELVVAAGEAPRISNRLRGPLTQLQASLERVSGPRVQHPAVFKVAMLRDGTFYEPESAPAG